MKKLFYWVLGIAIVIQFIRPDFKNPKVDENATLQADPQVMSVLQGACYDCHSNETKYPWYHNVAPVSWVMADHINTGRKALNFSNWENIDPKIKLERLKRGDHLVAIDVMPIGEYKYMHKKANLNQAQKELLENFFDDQIKKYTPKS